MAKLVAVDNGSTAIKYCWKNSQGKLTTGVFKSRFVDGLQMTNLDYAESSYDMPDGAISIDEQAANPIKTNTPQYQYSHYVRAGVFEALRRTGITGKVDLLITLPISHFYKAGSQGGINQDNVEKAKQNLRKAISCAKEGITLPTINEIKVYPEGVGALAEIISDRDGNLRDGFELTDKALIIDIGGSTVDIALIADLNGRMQEKMSITKGVLTIIEDFSALAQSKLRASTVITREFAELAFKGKEMLGQDFSEEVAKASRNFVSTIIREIEEKLADPMLKHVIICGGGANLVGNALKERIDSEGSGARVTIPNDPETTLARSIYRHEQAIRETQAAEAI